ncbi:capsular polysaccharide biosynthesis protein [Ochrobactrum haematophilum]|uniref:Capsular polysaccharide biosynthesis protein n=1 Tax=Brucella haematophila TaxID=419474 RepID=A0ABX1DT45_9HYPH|nr:capsular polysaccharide biosynthesis protein [Brucella haematophila]
MERDDPSMSLVQDDIGIYYDGTRPSRLEHLIAKPLSLVEFDRAQALIQSWRQGRVSKYNFAREYDDVLPDRYVLVVDQVCGDRSISYGCADRRAFHYMLFAALSENPDCTVIIKTHPDVFTRKRRGYLTNSAVLENPRVQWITENCHPVRLIENCERVYTVTSQIGFEALIWGKEVRCFGMPFYGGWGLTQDEQQSPIRRQKVSIEKLIHAALIGYARYVDPENGQSCEVEHAINYLAFQRAMRERLPRKLHAVGFSQWKQPILRRFTAGAEIDFHESSETVPANSHVLIWGKQYPPGICNPLSVRQVEDGFLRSVGLGAELTPPLSWVVDDTGIYYDATKASALTEILSNTDADKRLLKRAAALRNSIVAAGLSKYNVQQAMWSRPQEGRTVILVPGQVENDASLRWGAPLIATNIELLKAVRQSRPDAYIVYKPHPDVTAGLRFGGMENTPFSTYCDEILCDAGIAQVLGVVDEVHTMTSLTGFEALLRNIPVTCYGKPFYSGWGLTVDVVPATRKRQLSLDELVAGTLIQYPVYVSSVTGHYTTPERVVQELVARGVITHACKFHCGGGPISLPCAQPKQLKQSSYPSARYRVCHREVTRWKRKLNEANRTVVSLKMQHASAEIETPAQKKLRPQKRRRRLLATSFVVFVIVPTILGALYFAFVASDRYIASVGFAVRSMDAGSGGDFFWDIHRHCKCRKHNVGFIHSAQIHQKAAAWLKSLRKISRCDLPMLPMDRTLSPIFPLVVILNTLSTIGVE